MVDWNMHPSWDDATGEDLGHKLGLEGKKEREKWKSRGVYTYVSRNGPGKGLEGKIINMR